MKKRINELDGSRPVTAAMNGGHGTAKGFSSVLDVEGFNYFVDQYVPYHKSHPKLPIFASETSSALATRGNYANDKQKGYMSAYDVNAPEWGLCAEKAWRPVADNPFVAGCFVWTGFDYKGEPTPYAWPCINSHFGILDTCGFPKDTFYYYQSWWSDRPVLHIFPHWNWPGKEGQQIDVWCFSNCRRVELFLNGVSQGAKDMQPNGHLEWKVKYQPGTLLAKGIYAKGSRGDAETRSGEEKELTAEVATAGPPAAIVLQPDRASWRPMRRFCRWWR